MPDPPDKPTSRPRRLRSATARAALVVAVLVAFAAGIAVAAKRSTGGTPAVDAPLRDTDTDTAAARRTAAPASTPDQAARRRHVYVSRRGNDANNGSRSRPWRTISHAAQRVGPGTTVHVGPGFYSGPLNITRGGTERRRLRFVSNPRRPARIRLRRDESLAVVVIRGDHVTFEGFDVSGAGADGTSGISVAGSFVSVVGNRVHDLEVPCLVGGGNGGSGISAGSGRSEYEGHDLLIAENVVSRVGTGELDGECRLVHGIYASVPRVTIVNNVVHHAVGDGISSWHAATDLTISNNLSVLNGGAGILVGSGDSGATGEGNTRTQVTNNVVYRNTRTGIIESSDGEHPVGPGNRYLNNLLSENGGGNGGLLVRRGGSLVSENVEAGPRFAEPARGAAQEYRPAAGSPTIDAGTCAGAPSSDMDGVARPQGSAVDIGPYERRSTRGSCGG